MTERVILIHVKPGHVVAKVTDENGDEFGFLEADDAAATVAEAALLDLVRDTYREAIA